MTDMEYRELTRQFLNHEAMVWQPEINVYGYTAVPGHLLKLIEVVQSYPDLINIKNLDSALEYWKKYTEAAKVKMDQRSAYIDRLKSNK